MKIITLNTWGGRAGKRELLAFFERYRETTDVFCLQEVWSAPYTELEGVEAGGVALLNDSAMVYGVQEISETLSDHQYFFHPHHLENYGLMMLVRRGIDVIGSGDVFVHKHRGYVPIGDVGEHARNIQYVTLNHEGMKMTVLNFHGLWNGKGKTDSEDRIEQSKNIVNFIKRLDGQVVLCGDFNLLPDTASMHLIEKAGLRNLITEYGVTSTRTSHYTKPEKFADFILVSSDVHVSNFLVLPDEVSDHAPLLVEIK